MPKARRASAGKGRWRAQTEHDMAFADAMLVETGRVLPMFVIHSAKASYAVLTGWRDADDKLAVARVIKLFCIAKNAEALSFVAEAWSAAMRRRIGESEAEFEERATSLAPSEREDREEVIIAETSWRERGEVRSFALMRVIERGADGKPSGTTAGPLPDADAIESWRSRWADLLPERAPRPMEVAMAELLLRAMPGTGITEIARDN